jgi:hypothetical protein
MHAWRSRLAAALGLFFVVAVLTTGSPTPGFGAPPENPKDVNVVNTPSIVDVNGPSLVTPYHQKANAGFEEGLVAIGELPDVPAGKRLVVEHVSILGQVPGGSGQEMIATLQIMAGALAIQQHPLILNRQGTTFGSDHHNASQSMRLLVDAGDSVRVVLNRTVAVGSFGGVFAVSGYLVNQ